MTLKEMKEKVYRLIEELSDSADSTSESSGEITEEENHLTDDPDYEKKINTCINIIQNELARIKKIPDKMVYNTETSESGNIFTFPANMYQVFKIKNCEYEINGKEIKFDESYKGEVEIYYYKYPTLITEETDDNTYEFELDQDALEIMPFGVAGDMLKSDPSTNYGAYYSSRYNELKQMLDSRSMVGMIFIDTSEAID